MISRLLPALLIFFISQTIQADESEPWFTGPLFALSGQTVPRGHVAVFLSGNTATIDSLYDRLWDKVPTDKAKTCIYLARPSAKPCENVFSLVWPRLLT